MSPFRATVTALLHGVGKRGGKGAVVDRQAAAGIPPTSKSPGMLVIRHSSLPHMHLKCGFYSFSHLPERMCSGGESEKEKANEEKASHLTFLLPAPAFTGLPPPCPLPLPLPQPDPPAVSFPSHPSTHPTHSFEGWGKGLNVGKPPVSAFRRTGNIGGGGGKVFSVFFSLAAYHARSCFAFQPIVSSLLTATGFDALCFSLFLGLLLL